MSSQGNPNGVGDLTRLSQEEHALRFPYFSSSTALELGLAIHNRHISLPPPRAPIMISVTSFNRSTLFQCVAGGDPPDSADLEIWLKAKANTVRRFGHSSAFVEQLLLAGKKRPEELGLIWPDFAAQGGGFPIFLEITRTLLLQL